MASTAPERRKSASVRFSGRRIRRGGRRRRAYRRIRRTAAILEDESTTVQLDAELGDIGLQRSQGTGAECAADWLASLDPGGEEQRASAIVGELRLAQRTNISLIALTTPRR